MSFDANPEDKDGANECTQQEYEEAMKGLEKTYPQEKMPPSKAYMEKLEERCGNNFIDAFNEIAEAVHETAKEKGWWDNPQLPGKDNIEIPFDVLTTEQYQALKDSIDLNWPRKERNEAEAHALFHSEISESLEALRHGSPADDKIPEFTGVEAELADVIIRIMDYGQGFGYRIPEAIVAKIKFNKSREKMHGGKKF